MVELKKCEEPMHCLAELAVGGLQLGMGVGVSLATFWLVYLVQGVTIVLMSEAKSLFHNPIAQNRQNGTAVIEVAHDPDLPFIYNTVAVIFVCFIGTMVATDFMDMAMVFWKTEGLLNDLSLRAKCENSIIMTVAALMSLEFMVLVGQIMAATLTVANVVGNALSIYVVLQLDDAIKDYINTSGMRILAKDPGNRIQTIKNQWRTSEDGTRGLFLWVRIFSPALFVAAGLASWASKAYL